MKEVKLFYKEKVDESEKIRILFWELKYKSMPLLSRIAINYLAICSSSAEEERSFSLLANFIDKKSNRYKSDIVDAMIFVKLNL